MSSLVYSSCVALTDCCGHWKSGRFEPDDCVRFCSASYIRQHASAQQVSCLTAPATNVLQPILLPATAAASSKSGSTINSHHPCSLLGAALALAHGFMQLLSDIPQSHSW